MKIGIEAEGRFRGLKTLFINAEEAESHFMIPFGVHQVYISDLRNEINLWADHMRQLASSYCLTVERTSLGEKAPENICVVLRLQSQGFWNLKPTDQIKFCDSEGLAPGHVSMFTVDNAALTRPEAFAEDREIRL